MRASEKRKPSKLVIWPDQITGEIALDAEQEREMLEFTRRQQFSPQAFIALGLMMMSLLVGPDRARVEGRKIVHHMRRTLRRFRARENPSDLVAEDPLVLTNTQLEAANTLIHEQNLCAAQVLGFAGVMLACTYGSKTALAFVRWGVDNLQIPDHAATPLYDAVVGHEAPRGRWAVQ